MIFQIQLFNIGNMNSYSPLFLCKMIYLKIVFFY